MHGWIVINFIQLIYSLRELVIHREGFSKTSIKNKDENGEWEANFITISEDIGKKIIGCGDTRNKYNPVSKWGLYIMNNEFYLEPHNFSNQAMVKLIVFVDEYLNLLGYSSFVEDQKTQNTRFANTMFSFEKYHLGF